MITFFNADIAAKYGVPDTIVFEFFYKCCKQSEDKNENFYFDTYWTRCTRAQLMQVFKFFNEGDIKGILKRLEANGLIKSAKYLSDKQKFDHAKWYSITELGKQVAKENFIS